MTHQLMRVPAFRRALLFIGTCLLVTLVTKVVAGSEVRAALAYPAGFLRKEPPRPAELVNVPTRAPRDNVFVLDDTLFGRSGQLRARLLEPERVRAIPEFAQLAADGSAPAPRVIGLSTAEDPEAFSFITLLPWREKRGAYIGGYHVGWWPGERRIMPANYENPVGFVEVTPQNAEMRLSEHFRLRDFVTHDQRDVWPKYVVLREALLDKLELVLSELEKQGIPARHAAVLSGFRSPQYNARGVNDGGMARASRHQFGDAADLIIDDDRNGRMDDLNGDGRLDLRDTDMILRAVERVERRYPELVGGLGLYHAMGPSGPFAHIDVRGSKARWSNRGAARSSSRTVARVSRSARQKSAHKVGGCSATGESAVLCVRVR
jgi:hypothetical protein